MRIKHLFVPAIAATLVLSACGGSAEPAPTPAPDPGPTAAEIAATNDSIAAARAAEEARLAAERAAAQAERDRMAREATAARTTIEETVYFEYDEATITDATERTLRAKLQILRGSPTLRIRLEGHTDERGSTEYNLALGSRRAEAVQQFLTGFGITASVFTTTSFGEERPAANRSDEAAWALNRRVQFAITGGQIVTSEDN